MATVTIKTTTDWLQGLETLLYQYEQALDDHLYSIWYEADIREAQEMIATIRAGMNRMIGQAERQLAEGRADMSNVH